MFASILGEFFGTLFLLMIVVGSGIMGENLANGNNAITLLANSLATGFGLFVLIESLGTFSKTHFNPIVSLVEYIAKKIELKELIFNWLAQVLGAILGVILTHLMFGLHLIQISTKERNSYNLGVSEFIATFGLIATIILAQKKRKELTSVLVASYVFAAYWFTSSTSFANPAVTIARTFTNTFCGIAPSGLLMFIGLQFIGGILAFTLARKS